MRQPFLIISFLLISFYSFACLNGETKELKNGVFVYEDYQGIVPKGHIFFKENYPKLSRELDSLYRITKDIDYLSDKGYVLIIEGKYNEALEIYLKIEKLKPNRYSTASNIGTVYELLGENQKALFWINRAIQINPKSHNSSEWLHSKILQAKIGGTKFHDSNFLINTNFGNYDEPVSSLSKSERQALIKSLYYQLNERVSFIKKEDPIIGILLFDLANLAYIEKKYNNAQEIYEKARDYGFNGELLKKRASLVSWKISENLYKSIDKLRSVNEYHKNLFITTLITSSIIILLLLIMIWRKRKK